MGIAGMRFHGELRPYARTARLTLRGVALVWFLAFASLGMQVRGLYGERGILPAQAWLDFLGARLGDGAVFAHPTLLWLGAGDAALVASCVAGAAAALALFAGYVPALSAAACWILYFSLFQVGRVFLSFQWDLLLLEAGFLAVFLAPLRLRTRAMDDVEPPFAAVWMLRWLVFRLMFASGVVKLLSGDPAWWNLGALEYHYWTQPLPTWTAWLADQLPPAVHRACVAAMFVVELIVPWMVLGPRRARLAAFVPLVTLQAAIAATGNFAYFNLLTAVLCLSLLDDDAIAAAKRRLLGRGRGVFEWPAERPEWSRSLVAGRVASAILAAPLALAGGAAMASRLGWGESVPAPILRWTRGVESLRLASSYGLFAWMTKDRREVVIEGSLDGRQWREYELPYKPGDPRRRPRFVAPMQPRLDWQFWFAALGDPGRHAWVELLERRLLEGSPEVLSLFELDPFEGRPPRHTRAVLFEYRFTDWSTRGETGAWWTRRRLGQWSPTRTGATASSGAAGNTPPREGGAPAAR